jgi:peptide/nickel transport system permease protein
MAAGRENAARAAAEPRPVAAAEESVLEVDGLTVAFGAGDDVAPALDAISFAIAPGEVLGIVGESGSGKSVLVRAIMGLLPEGGETRAGAVRYRGRDLTGLSDAELRPLRGMEIAHILPDAKSQLNPVLRIERLMADVVEAHADLSDDEAHRRSVEALRLLSIPDPERRLAAYPHELSGGMAQRVCIALALTHDPDLIVADEPTAGLDVTVQRQVLDLMSETIKRRRTAQLIVTRDLGIVAHYCDRMAVMHDGRIVEAGPTLELFDAPRDPYTQRLLTAVRPGRRRAEHHRPLSNS